MYSYISGALVSYRSPGSASCSDLHLFLGLPAIKQSPPPPNVPLTQGLKENKKLVETRLLCSNLALQCSTAFA